MLSRSIVSTSVVGMSALTNDCAVDSSHKMLNFILNKPILHPNAMCQQHTCNISEAGSKITRSFTGLLSRPPCEPARWFKCPNPRSNKQLNNLMLLHKLYQLIVQAAHTWICVTCPKLAWNAWPINAANVFFHVNYLLIIDCCFKNTGRNYLHIIMVFTTQ